MSNRLEKETSPYLLQHKDNPVDWYPWGEEAFDRAAKEDKPIFLSIGYSACHWCHVLAHESFEDEEIAEILNQHFISIKVDKEERPDIDSVYMAVCQAFTGSGGWPTSIFMTPARKPFFAGTYFPKTSRGGMVGLRDLLLVIHEKWISNRNLLLQQSEEIVQYLQQRQTAPNSENIDLPGLAVKQFERSYDAQYGGFGQAPKFPTPHNLLFLLDSYERHQTPACLNMAEHTLTQMYRGGLFDHIGFGFCRYATDDPFLVPHFEKMLYDNALLLLAYCKAYTLTGKALYLEIAEKTAGYILSEMTAPEGGFFSSQDADSEGEEGKYYLFTPDEIIRVLGQDNGAAFCRHYDITDKGNFEGKNIPNLLQSDPLDVSYETFLPPLKDYRSKRSTLHRDEKILTAWNSLMVAALCQLYLVSGKAIYLSAGKKAYRFIRENLCDGETLYVHFHAERRGVKGFLDDYATCIFAALSLYRATLDQAYLTHAKTLCKKVLQDFSDEAGGFYLYSSRHEALILRPKETYDGAIPSGNSFMAYNLVHLSLLTDETQYKDAAQKQLQFLTQNASPAPMYHSLFLCALLHHNHPPMKITIVPDEETDTSILPRTLPANAVAVLLPRPTEAYPLKNGKTTYYVCKGHSCLPPTNQL